MSFIGNAPAAIPTSFQTVQADSFNGTGSAVNFTLSRQITNLYDIEVLVDNVQQSPYDGSYSVAGTTLTFSSAPSSGTNNIYVIYRDHPITSIAPVGNLNVDGDVSVSGTTKTNAIVDYSGGTTATINGYTPSASNMAGRNKVINGAMMIDQRNAGAAVTYDGSSGYSLDRYFSSEIGNGSFTVQQVSDAPAGFSKSLKVVVTGAQTGTLNASTLQAIEGYNVADLAWGTADAKTVTLSFWVKSSVTGTLSGVLQNSASNRSYPFTYSVSSASTWEYKTITIAGDTSGTWATDNTAGIWIRFTHGTSQAGTAGTWASADYRGASGATYVIETLNATWQLTGVQLEVGSTASEFEHRQYGTELQLCQRYFWKTSGASANNYVGSGFCDSSTAVATIVAYPVRMRAIPTLQTSGTASDYQIRWAGANITTCSTVPTGTDRTEMFARIDVSVSGGLTTGYGGLVRNANTNGFFAYTAEL